MPFLPLFGGVGAGDSTTVAMTVSGEPVMQVGGVWQTISGAQVHDNGDGTGFVVATGELVYGLPIAGATGVSATSLTPWEAALQLAMARGSNYEALAAFSSAHVTAWEALLSISKSGASQWTALARVLSSRSTAWG